MKELKFKYETKECVQGQELLRYVAHKRMEMIEEEVQAHYPGAHIVLQEREEGRLHISILWEGHPIGEEFIETSTSWDRPERMKEYRKILAGNTKRLVVLVPERHASRARLKMLDLNHWWMFYYQVYGYDQDGHIKKQGRPRFCSLEPGYA
ncbi:MAG: hypothetical protein QW520_06455 [Methanomassiliicoccales archaeon]